MTENEQKQLGKTLWTIADQLRGSMNADDFRDYMLSFLFLRYLSDNYEQAAKKELGADYPEREPDEGSGDDKIPARPPLARWYEENAADVGEFEKQMRRKVHYVIEPDFLWGSIVRLAKSQNGKLLDTLQKGFKYIEEKSFESNFQGLFSEINLASEKLGRKYEDRNDKLCSIISELAKGMSKFSTDTDTLEAHGGPLFTPTFTRPIALQIAEQMGDKIPPSATTLYRWHCLYKCFDLSRERCRRSFSK